METTTVFKKVCESQFGIRPRHVVDAVADPTAVHPLFSDEGLTLKLYGKAVERERDPYWTLLLVVTKGTTTTVNFGAKVPLELLARGEKPTPLALFQALLSSFGREITIGSERSRLHDQKTIPLTGIPQSVQDVVQIHSPAGADFIQQTFIKILAEPPRAECALAFALDRGLYVRFLVARGLV